MRFNRSDREVFGIGGFAFGFLALVLAFAALVTAAHSESNTRAEDRRITKLAGSGLVGSTAKVTLREYSIVTHPGLVKSGKVTLQVTNSGSIIHELVVFRSPGAAALPKVKVQGERSVGAINEEVVPESDKMGETGDVAVGKTVTKTFNLPPGSYVMFCNIDNKIGGKLFNHFTHGMVATLLVV